MSDKHEGNMLQDVAKKIGSTLGGVAAEASKIVQPLRKRASRVLGTKSRAHRTQPKRSAAASVHSVTRKRRARRTSKARAH